MYALSGVILNHREGLSAIDINRKYLPETYKINNWDNAAVKATEKINNDSILIYGNIGIWLTDSTFSRFTDFNNGFPEGIDNRKVCQMLYTGKDLLAGTFFGLYHYDFSAGKWIFIDLPVEEKRITDLLQIKDSLFILTRSHLLITNNLQDFEVKILPPPIGYNNKIGLFKTLWVIHSGEIYGHTGKILVDVVGLIFIFLTVTGLILWINKGKIRRKKVNGNKLSKILRINKWNLKWHNRTGWITVLLLLITTTTGIFLRPPFLIAIADVRVGKIPYTELDTDNPWFDQLRRISYDAERHRFLVVTSKGFFYSDDNFTSPLKPFRHQPPASVMGVTVFRRTGPDTYLVGSFEGLYFWNTQTGEIYDYIEKKTYIPPAKKSRPIGQYLVTGYTMDFQDREIAFTYNMGALNINGGKAFPSMPEVIKQAYTISLWSVALETHTGRMFEFILGDFYILIVPLVGLGTLFILISGFWVWFKFFRKKQ